MLWGSRTACRALAFTTTSTSPDAASRAGVEAMLYVPQA